MVAPGTDVFFEREVVFGKVLETGGGVGVERWAEVFSCFTAVDEEAPLVVVSIVI